jgi:hypothetical protein
MACTHQQAPCVRDALRGIRAPWAVSSRSSLHALRRACRCQSHWIAHHCHQMPCVARELCSGRVHCSHTTMVPSLSMQHESCSRLHHWRGRTCLQQSQRTPWCACRHCWPCGDPCAAALSQELCLLRRITLSPSRQSFCSPFRVPW